MQYNTHVLKIQYTINCVGQQQKLAAEDCARSASSINTLFLQMQRHIILSQLQSKTWERMVGPLGVILRVIGGRLVEATGEPREANIGSVKI